MASYTGLMGGSQLSIIGTHVSGMLANPMSIPPSISGANQTSQAATIYTYGAYGSIICICGPITSPGTTLSGTLPPNSPPCHPSPPTPPAACPTTSQHSPVGHPPCIARAISANHFLYDSQYLDTVSGLYYLRARWYDPATGQFISVDALVGITDQPYQYVGGDPVNLTDPTGLACWAALELGLTKVSRQCWKSGYKRAGHDTVRAWNDTGGKVVHAVATHTIGLCLNGEVGAGPTGFVSLCLGFAGGHFFLKETAGGGGAPNAGASLGLLFSNATNPHQLAGPFAAAGSSADPFDQGPSVGADGAYGTGHCDAEVWEAQPEIGLSLDNPLLPFETHGGVTNTWVQVP